MTINNRAFTNNRLLTTCHSNECLANDKSQYSKTWWVYLIRMHNDALYCGITNDLERRLKMHQAGKGAKSLRGKGPLKLVWSQQQQDKTSALKIEYQIKQLTKASKEKIVAENKRVELATS